MRGRLLGIGVGAVVALALAALFPPVVMADRRCAGIPETWKALREWLAPTDVEWVGPRYWGWGASAADGLIANDSSNWVPQELAWPTLLLEGLLILLAGALLCGWVLARERYARAVQAGVAPTRAARWGPGVCLVVLMGLVVSLTAVRIPTRAVAVKRGYWPGIASNARWRLTDRTYEGDPLKSRFVSRQIEWKWAWYRPPAYGGTTPSNWARESREPVWLVLAPTWSGIGLVTLAAAWFGILRPRKRILAAIPEPRPESA